MGTRCDKTDESFAAAINLVAGVIEATRSSTAWGLYSQGCLIPVHEGLQSITDPENPRQSGYVIQPPDRQEMDEGMP